MATADSSAKRLRFIVIGNPANRRITFFEQAVQRFGYRSPRVVPYRDILKGSVLLDEVLHTECERARADSSTVVLRIESPGEDFDVERRLIARGETATAKDARHSRISPHAAVRLRADHGRIMYPGQWYAGFQNLLADFSKLAKKFPAIRWLNAPDEIAKLFDKRRCHRLLAAAGVSVPNALRNVLSFDDLRDRMLSRDWNRVFVKLASGSSASGVIALHRDGKQFRALTSMESCGSGNRVKYYNNLKLRSYHANRDIRRVVDFLCCEGAHVEQWLPKAALAGRQFDLRVIAIRGQASHAVVRTSTGPITNLHLGNRRGNLGDLQLLMGKEKWHAVVQAAEKAATVFPKSHCLGLDIMLRPGFRQPTLLEANAFGDLLPGILFRELNTYEAQVAALM